MSVRILLLIISLLIAARVGAQELSSNFGPRLSDWLMQQPENSYFEGTHLSSKDEVPSQELLKQRLLSVETPIRAWVLNKPVTGRIFLKESHPRWLQAHPSQDPFLTLGDVVRIPMRPKHVSVLRSDGVECRLQQDSMQFAGDYVRRCLEKLGLKSESSIWLIHPNGSRQRLGVDAWNSSSSVVVLPGSWLWVPLQNNGLSDAYKEDVAKFIGTQEMPSDVTYEALASEDVPNTKPLVGGASLAPRLSMNAWGTVGILQMPSARFNPSGYLGVGVSRVYPYTNYALSIQPFRWVEVGIRYTEIANRIYGVTSRDYTDKGFDLKLLLSEEGRYTPQVAMGLQDLAGTGLFSSEYIVLSKRWYDFDVHAGLVWGYLSGSGSFGNPFGVISGRLKNRKSLDFGMGGKFSLDNYFSGRVSPMFGLSWMTPVPKLLLNIEYDGNDYKNEPLSNPQVKRSPYNVGASYEIAKDFFVKLGYERGDRVSFGFNLGANLAETYMPKDKDPDIDSMVWEPRGARYQIDSDERLKDQLELLTGWKFRSFLTDGDELVVYVDSVKGVYLQDRLDKAVQVLNKQADIGVRRFVFALHDRGLWVSTKTVDRAAWLSVRSEGQRPSVRSTPYEERAPESSSVLSFSPLSSDMKWALNPSYSYILGGPDKFLLHQIGVALSAEWVLSKKIWLNSVVNYRLFDNYKHFTYTAPSDLPRVRTYQREFVTTSRLTIPTMQINFVDKLLDDWYYGVYGGALEWMYAGAGGEILYRPWHSSIALGLDMNFVVQRDFDQKFSVRDYRVLTGHAALYWNTGWNGLQANLYVGRYLAKDVGATVELSKKFDNGVSVGGFATKTNISAQQFGEGSFDKGIFISVPFDVMLPKSSVRSASIIYHPLTRDGGARLGRATSLYSLSNVSDKDSFAIRPARPFVPANGDSIFH